jgi:O-antigen/teichoic acid export membrane protein
MHVDRLKHFVQLLAANVLTKAAWAASLLLLLHRLGAEQFGVLATLWALSSLLAGAADLGVSQVLLRDGSQQRGLARPLALRAIQLQACTSAVGAISLVAYAWYLVPFNAGPGSVRLISILCGVVAPFIDRFQNLFTVFGQLSGTFNQYVAWRSIGFFLALAGFATFVHKPGDLCLAALIYLLSVLLTSCIMGQRTWRLLPPSQISDLEEWTALAAKGLPFLYVSLLTLAYGKAEVSILGSTGATALAGQYHAVYQTILLAYSLSAIWFTVVFPQLYENFQNRDRLNRDFTVCVKALSIVAWAGAVPLFVYAPQISRFIAGTKAAEARVLLRNLAPLILLIPGTAILNFLLPMNLIRKRVLCDMAGVSVTIAGVALARFYGSPAAISQAAVLGYAVSVLSATLFLRRSTRMDWLAPWRALTSCGLRAMPLAAALEMASIQWWLGCLLYMTLFTMLLLVTRYVTLDQLASWRTKYMVKHDILR